MPKKIRIRDLSLRDGQQALTAGLMTTADIEGLLPHYREAGFHIMEVWGGDIPLTAVSVLDESPWHRLRVCAEAMKGSSLIGAVARGRNLFGDSPYPNFVLEGFYKEAVADGLQVLRVFDPLNDMANIRDSVQMAVSLGGKADAAVCYAVDPREEPRAKAPEKRGFLARLFGTRTEEETADEKVFTDEYYVGKAKEMEAMGAKIITLLDPSGIITPSRVFSLMPKLKHAVRCDVDFHTRCTAGNGLASALTAIIKGVDIVDTCVWWFAGGTAAPPVELLRLFCERMEIELDADFDAVASLRKAMEPLRRRLTDEDAQLPKDFDEALADMPRTVEAEFDRAIKAASDNEEEALLDACRTIEDYFGFPPVAAEARREDVPAGVYASVVSALRAREADDLLPEALALVSKVRRDAGLVPLADPIGPVIGSQAALLALDRRDGSNDYSERTAPFIRLIRGEFGNSPKPVSPDFRTLITGLPEQTLFDTASYKDPANPTLEEYGGCKLAVSDEEFILLELFPEAATAFLRRRREEDSGKAGDTPEIQ